MTAQELRQKYLEFFKSKGHTIIPSALLVPENDPSVLFTSAGMQPLVPYLMGESHPGGKRVASVQKCVRTIDIDDVGDNRHCTFFEMLGNWSFGDYFKKEAIEWSAEFLFEKKWLGLDPKRIFATTFRGEGEIPADDVSPKIWQEVFEKYNIKAEIAGVDEMIKDNIKIIPLGAEDNFWIAGATGPCGSDTEMFYDTRPQDGAINDTFQNLVKSGRLIEIWNDVFMEYEKKIKSQKSNLKDTSENSKIEYEYVKLKQQNVDTGMGIERTLAVLNGKENIFETELFQPIFQKIALILPQKMEPQIPFSEEIRPRQQYYEVLNKKKQKSFRIIADHLRTAAFMLADGVIPSNVERGYILRRIIRRAIRHGKILGVETNFTDKIAEVVIGNYGKIYQELENNKNTIFDELEKEENKFRETLEKGLKEFAKMINVSGTDAFNLYQTYGFPLEMTEELALEKGIKINKKEFEKEFKKHQDKSRTASAGQFKGGLQSQDASVTKLHTATHLLDAALRQVLGEHVYQKGSNITPERLRFDFSHPEKMTSEQIQKVEDLVNEQIQKDLSVNMEEMSPEEAQKQGAVGVFGHKYGEVVKVYTVGSSPELAEGSNNFFSREICGGPHVEQIGVLGKFKIIKEEASSAGVRRIKAILE